MATGTIKHSLDRPVTVTALMGTLEKVSVIQEGKLVSGYISFGAMTCETTYSWMNLARISVPSNVEAVAHAYLSADGSYCGIIRFKTDGIVQIYGMKTFTDKSMNFMFAYRTT